MKRVVLKQLYDLLYKDVIKKIDIPLCKYINPKKSWGSNENQ